MEDGSAWAQQGRVLKLRGRRAHQGERKAEAAEILNRAKHILLKHLLTPYVLVLRLALTRRYC